MDLHARHIITSAEISSPSTVDIKWADGHMSHFPGLWLLSACSCARCGSTESAVRHALLTELPDEPEVVSVSTDVEGCLNVEWGDGHRSCFEPIWLRGHCLSDEEREHRLFKPQLWGKEIGNSLPYMSYTEVSADADRHLGFLETLRDLGFVILQAVPADRERTEEIADLVGKLRLTNYGIFELKSKPNPEIVGDMAVALNLHTDEPYRRDPPAITLFHVLAQSDHGGDSTITDGFHVAEALRRQDPKAFKILASKPARFHRTLKEGRAFEIEAPIISVDHTGAVTGIRILDRGMAPVDASVDDVVPFYGAVRKFLALVYAGEGMITIKLQPGEMLVFNNQRLLHGRTAFDPSCSARHVRSCHVDLDEFHSKLRVAYRASSREEAWMKFRQGAAL